MKRKIRQDEENDNGMQDASCGLMDAAAALVILGDENQPETKVRGGQAKTFAKSLLESLRDDRNSESISWLPGGLAFRIVNVKLFEREILPKYFKSIKFCSFTRMLNKWGFVRIIAGPDKGAYAHNLFQRGKPKLCQEMNCTKSSKCAAVKSLRKADTVPSVRLGEQIKVRPDSQDFASMNNQLDKNSVTSDVLRPCIKHEYTDDLLEITSSIIREANLVLLRSFLNDTPSQQQYSFPPAHISNIFFN